MDVYWFPKVEIAGATEEAETTMSIIQVVTMAATMMTIINPKHQRLSVLQNGLRRVYGNRKRKNSCEAFVSTELVKLKFPPASNGLVAAGIHWFSGCARFVEVRT